MPHRARTRWLATLSLGLVAAAPLAFAQNNAAPSGAKSESKVIPTPDVPPDSITEGSVKVGGTDRRLSRRCRDPHRRLD